MTREDRMFALVGRVRITPGHEEETAAMARAGGPALLASLSGRAAYWVRTLDDNDATQHSFWLFETEAQVHPRTRDRASVRDPLWSCSYSDTRPHVGSPSSVCFCA